MPVDLISRTAAQLDQLSPSKTVFIFPVGPLEDHGPHLPVGLDLYTAEKMARGIGEKLENDMPGWTAVIMPSAPLGLESNTKTFSITVRPHVLRDWLVDACRSLKRSGFRHFACVSGHLGPRQLTAIEEAGKRFGGIMKILNPAPNIRLLSVSSALVSAKDVLRSPFWPDPKEHGGEKDTSLGHYIVPDHMEKKRIPLDEKHREGTFVQRAISRFFGRLPAYWGNPSKGKSEAGRAKIDEWIKEVFPKLRAVWEGSPPRSNFRSWYSILPPNWSFFKAWVLFLFVFVLMLAWMWLFYQDFDVYKF